MALDKVSTSQLYRRQTRRYDLTANLDLAHRHPWESVDRYMNVV